MKHPRGETPIAEFRVLLFGSKLLVREEKNIGSISSAIQADEGRLFSPRPFADWLLRIQREDRAIDFDEFKVGEGE